MDSFLAARQIGDSGRVLGIDMTEAQLAKSRRLAAEHSVANVAFIEARIEQLPLSDSSADVVISNGVINLAPDKATVFAETARVLRPGGRLALAAIVTSAQLPVGVTCAASLWAACIGGAMQRDDYREAIEAAGFELDDLRENGEYRFVSERAENATRKYGVKSVSLLATKR
jgi:arsenite methyltransferase